MQKPCQNIMQSKLCSYFACQISQIGFFENIYLIKLQRYNAARFKLRGYGTTLDPHTLTEEELVTAVNHVLTTPTYQDAITNCSAIVKSMPSPRETLKFWVNHILQFGGQHLKPRYLHRPLYEIFMLDVFLLWLVFSIVLFVVMWFICWRLLCYKKKVKVD